MKIFDVSLPLNDKTVIYPGNVGLEISAHHEMPEYATHLSKITMGSHTGTHVDAPRHALPTGASLDKIPLETFVGPCRVLDFTKSVGSVSVEDLKREKVKKTERILVKTQNSLRGFTTFYDDYVFLSGDAADYLAELGVALFGIDYFSVKQRGSKDQRPHTSLLSKNIPIIEGLDLSQVPAGSYTLVCLPLKFTGIEGAPARVVLINAIDENL
ncbi:MAG: cyclase family protein [Candidatus Taylorbacteria bacterium]|nr:cyclase family protein [Candidatus Taylorbacteria bacterium]